MYYQIFVNIMNTLTEKCLLLFARPPRLGKVKTRLAATLGATKTLEVYKELLHTTLATARASKLPLQLHWAAPYTQPGYLQRGSNLGERMYNAMLGPAKMGRVCLIGTDTPGLSVSIINEAFDALQQVDVVFGPATDGGYYLVGCKGQVPASLFLNKTWSHGGVLQQALQECSNLQLTTHLLPPLNDIDTYQDYVLWQQAKAQNEFPG